jgi:thioredoxin 1
MMGKVFYDLTETEDIKKLNDIIHNYRLCVIDFYADWCGPCLKLGKEIEDKIMNEDFYKHIKKNSVIGSNNIHQNNIAFIKINVDTHPEIAQIYKIKSIPHVIFYKNNELQETIIKGCDYDAFVKKIKELL